MPTPLALCEVEKTDGLVEEAQLLVQRDEYCDEMLPASEARTEATMAVVSVLHDDAQECWEELNEKCAGTESATETLIKKRQLGVMREMHESQLAKIKKPRKMEKSTKTGADRAEKRSKKEKRQAETDLLYNLYDPYSEDVQYSLEYCRKRVAIMRFYHKSLRQKIQFCNESRVYQDTLYDAYSSFLQVYNSSLVECQGAAC